MGRLARAVGPAGHVFAVDPEPAVLDIMRRRLRGVRNVIDAYEKARVNAGMRFRIGLLTRMLERSSVLGFVSCTECSGHLRVAELCEHILDPQKPKAAEPVFNVQP